MDRSQHTPPTVTTFTITLDMTSADGRRRAGMTPWRVGYVGKDAQAVKYVLVYARDSEEALRVAAVMLCAASNAQPSLCSAQPLSPNRTA